MSSPLSFLESFPPAEVARLIADQSDFMLTVIIAGFSPSWQDAVMENFLEPRRTDILKKAVNVDVSRVQTIVAGVAEKLRARVNEENSPPTNATPFDIESANSATPANRGAYSSGARSVGNAYAAQRKSPPLSSTFSSDRETAPRLPADPAVNISLSNSNRTSAKSENFSAPKPAINELRSTLDRLSPKLRENLAANGIVPMPPPPPISDTQKNAREQQAGNEDSRSKLSRQILDRQNEEVTERTESAEQNNRKNSTKVPPRATSWSARILDSVQSAFGGRKPANKNSQNGKGGTAKRSGVNKTSAPSSGTRSSASFPSSSSTFSPTPDTKQLLREALAQARIQAARIEKREISPMQIDGLSLAASILRESSPLVREHICDAVPEIYEQLRRRMFVFADLEKSPAKSLSAVFSTVAPESAALALRFGSEALLERVRRVLSPRRMQLIDDELARPLKGLRLGDVEKTQQHIIDVAVDLQHRGEIIIDANAPDLI